MKKILFREWIEKQNDDYFEMLTKVTNSPISRPAYYRFMLDVSKGVGRQSLRCVDGTKIPIIQATSLFKDGRVMVRIFNTRTGQQGAAFCHEKDTFDPTIGIAYAWARYKGEKIHFSVPISKLVFGEKFLVLDSEYTFVSPHPVLKNCWIVLNNESNVPFNTFGDDWVEVLRE